MTKQYFCHTHVHTEYSLLDGVIKIEPLVKKIKSMGHTAVAVTDHGVMYSLVKMNKACKEEGIKHIIGCEFYVAPNSRFDKKAKKGEAVYHHLIVLAKDKIGYKQIIKLCSLGFIEGFYYKPRIDEELLFGVEPGHLIITTACIGSSFAQSIIKATDDITSMLQKYQNYFGEDFYLEVQNHGIPEEKNVSDIYEYYSPKLGIPIIATQDSHYLNKEDYLAHDVALCLGTGQNFAEPRKFKFDGTNYHILTTEEMLTLYKPEWLSNTKLIVDKCEDGILEYGKIRLPKFVPPDIGEDQEYDEWLVRHNGQAINNQY